MSALTLPADTVQFYNDGPEFPTTPLLLKAEQAYREGFATTASAASSWKRVDEDMLEEMCRSRRVVRRKAEILVLSAELFDCPGMDSEQIVYCAGHDVEAARARGKVHGLEFARQCWDELEAEGVSEVLIGSLVLAPWAEQICEWSRAKIKPDSITPPPRPEECIPGDNQAIIDEEHERGIAPFCHSTG